MAKIVMTKKTYLVRLPLCTAVVMLSACTSAIKPFTNKVAVIAVMPAAVSHESWYTGENASRRKVNTGVLP